MSKKKALVSLLLCGTMIFGALPVSAESRTYDDREEIVKTGIDLTAPTTLTIAKPLKAVTTTAAKYYITGSSDPEKNLTVNGVAVEDRGRFGSWGVQVNLAVGKNVFTINNGGVLVLSVILSAIVLKEKLNKNIIYGSILTVLSIIALSL